MSDKVTRMAEEIYANVGGVQNVQKIIHCMTRVRLRVVDKNKVNNEGLKAVEGVLGVVEDEGLLQVVVGPGTVNKVAQKMVDIAGVKLGETFPNKQATLEELTQQSKAQAKEKYDKPSKFKSILKSISSIFVPLIPAFVGAGMIAGVAAIMSNLIVSKHLDGAVFQQYVDVMNLIKNGIFSYLVIYVGINTATEFGGTPAVGGVIGAVPLLTGMNPEKPLTNLFTGAPLQVNQGGIIGVIFSVWLACLLEKQLRRVVPDAIDIIVTPTLVLLVMGLVTIFFTMPIAGLISSNLVNGIHVILKIGGAFAGFALGALFLPMVMFGLHQILTPIHVQMIETTGSTQLLPILAMAGAGQVGAAIALWVRLRRHKEITSLIKGALPVGVLGIGEPLIYAVTLPLGRPFITACIGGGIGGAIIGGFGHVGAIAIGPSGVALIPLIANGKWFIYVLGLLGAYVGGFVVTNLFGIPKDLLEKEENNLSLEKK